MSFPLPSAIDINNGSSFLLHSAVASWWQRHPTHYAAILQQTNEAVGYLEFERLFIGLREDGVCVSLSFLLLRKLLQSTASDTTSREELSKDIHGNRKPSDAIFF